jgi:glycosyltransferase involved in cell wall biosynthesis
MSMEHMARGLPVVCTDSGGNRELVVEGATGVFVPPSDSEAVIAALRSLRRDPQVAASLGRAGRERIATHFTVDRMVHGTLSVYESVAGRLRQ